MTEKVRTIISTHIPRTGGTSLMMEYDHLFGADQIIVPKDKDHLQIFHKRSDYPFNYLQVDTIRRILKDTSALLQLFNSLHASVIEKYLEHNHISMINKDSYSMIHGHFNTEEIQPYVDDPINIIMFRDPFERIISQFKIWTVRRGTTGYKDIAYDPMITFHDYIRDPININRQASQIMNICLDDFDIVGTNNNLPKYLDQVQKLSDKSKNWKKRPIRLNTTRSTTTSNSQYKKYQKEFESLNKLDIEIYKKAEER